MNYPHIGNKEAKNKVLKFIQTGKNVLIYGKQGIGKTSFVQMLEKYWEVIEINASEVRTKRALQNALRGIVNNKSFFKKDKIAFLDEVDSLTTEGADVVAKYLLNATTPIILAANYIKKVNKKILNIETLEQVIFEPPSKSVIYKFLSLVSTEECIETTKENLKRIAIECEGDVRDALHMLRNNGERYVEKNPESSRKLLLRIFNEKDRKKVYEHLLDNVELGKTNWDDFRGIGLKKKKSSIVTILLYLAENYPKFYTTTSKIILASEALKSIDKTLFRTKNQKYQLALMAFLLPVKDEDSNVMSVSNLRYRFKWRR